MLIGILSALGFYAFTSAQQKARDGKRKTDLAEVKKALEHAKNDCKAGSYYPVGSPSTMGYEKNGYTWLKNYLTNNNLQYLGEGLDDPQSNAGNFYAYDVAELNNNVCPISTLALTNKGTKTWILRVKLELGSRDPDNARTFNTCSDKITTINLAWGGSYFIGSNPVPSASDGYYYVCND